MTSSRALAAAGSLAVALLAALPADARAAACCVGSTSPFPIRVGECEKVVAGFSAGHERALGRWDRDGALADVGVPESAVLADLGVGVRFNRRLQVAAILPVRANARVGEDGALWGGGVGDASALLTWDPMEEKAMGPPTPVFTAAVRMPTGRDWTEAEGALMEDVTGLPNPAATLGVALERSIGQVPWMVGVDGVLGVTRTHDIQPGVTVSGSVGRYLGTSWSLLGSASWSANWAATDGSADMVARPRVGARVVYGQRLRYRAWLGTDWDLPVPGLGRSATQVASASVGVALVR